MGLFYRDQKVEIEYHDAHSTRKTAIYSNAMQVSTENIPNTSISFLCIRYLKEGTRYIDRYNVNDVIRLRMSPVNAPKGEDTTDTSPEEEVIGNEDHDN